LPRGEFKVLWASDESVGYEINLASGSHGELQISLPKTLAHLFRRRERVTVIIEKLRQANE